MCICAKEMAVLQGRRMSASWASAGGSCIVFCIKAILSFANDAFMFASILYKGLWRAGAKLPSFCQQVSKKTLGICCKKFDFLI